MLVVIFEVFWSKSRVLGQIGRSGKVLGFISSNFGPNPTAGRPPKGNNRGAIIIIVIPASWRPIGYRPHNLNIYVNMDAETDCFSQTGVIVVYTPGSTNSLFSDFFREFWRGILGGVRDYLG